MFRVAKTVVPALQLVLGQQGATGSRCMSDLALRPTVLKSGTDGRSSVSGATATVFGASGFIGHYVVNELARIGSQVVVPFRCSEEKAITLRQMGDLGQVVLLKEWTLENDDMTREAISRSNVVINLVGQTLETRNYSWEDVHTAWPQRLAAMVKEAPNVERFLHMSCLGADANAPSRRMRSKAAGDEAVRAAVPSATIFRPGPVVGEEDDFFNNLLFQLKFNLYVPLIDGGEQQLQPALVTDVSAAMLAALRSKETMGQTYHLGGPEVLRLREIVHMMYETLHETERQTVYMPAAIAKLMAAPTDMLRRKLPPMPSRNYMYTADWVDELNAGKVVPSGAKTFTDLDITPHKVTDGLAVELIRYQRTGGYEGGDTSQLAKALPTKVKKYFGMHSGMP